MPYDRISDLPEPVKNVLPREAAEVWRAAFNSAEKAGNSEESAARIAWSAVKRAGWEKGPNGTWVKVKAAKEAESFFNWLMELVSKAVRLSKQRESPKPKGETVTKQLITGILKVDQEKQIVSGIVLEPDTEDAQGDIISAEEIEKAAHGFLVKSRVVGKFHSEVAKADVVESYIAPQDFTINDQTVKKGSWVMSVKVHDPDLWEQIKAGEVTGFSIGAVGIRQSI